MKLQERIEKMEKELAELKASVVAQSVEWPVEDESYWTISAHGYVRTYRFYEDEFHQGFLQFGNIFRTKEEAEREVERRKVLTQLRELAKAARSGMKCNWKVGVDKWYAPDAHGRCEWLVSYTCSIEIPGAVYFPSEKSTRDAIKTVGVRIMMFTEV